MQLLKLFVLMVCSCCLIACVSTTESPKSFDKQRALEANVKLGMAYLEKGHRDGAMRSFTKALQFDKKSSEANLGMALLHQLNGEMDMAEKSFSKALKGRADFSKSIVQFSYGKFLMGQEKYNDAMVYFELVSTDYAYQRRAEALYFLGLSALYMDDKIRAKGAFEYSLNLKSDVPGPALELATISFDEQDYPNAKKYLEMFAKSTRHTPRSLLLGIRLERVFGNQDKEASYVMALKNMHPYSKEYLEYKKLTDEN